MCVDGSFILYDAMKGNDTCDGFLDAFVSDKVKNNAKYTWVYTDSNNVSTTSTNKTYIFNASDIGINGTYTVVVTVEGTEEDGYIKARDISEITPVILVNCVGKPTINNNITNG